MFQQVKENDSEYERLKQEVQTFFSRVGKVFSPVFKESVHFTPEGFQHLVSEDGKKEREKANQLLRFRLLPLAVELIQTATTYQEYDEATMGVRVKRRKEWFIRNTPIRYWSLIGIIDERKFKVIIKKVGDNGPLHFWSVVPNWITSWHRDIKLISTMEGNPEVD